ncbi:hypothetical protein [Rhodalgimonas zhirmunskyi]|uniref:Sulfotransferase family protein n=1 Tax=Rhodalgimonas zhirmunskyi TaxID=2964767 RepID=A0AAJ1UEA1_9RHOB|nr:hypothetical protein [Rhodoalgimonas zhirmunskyi]MDQ2094472.1 hypothetical protein [Rhodoalgimonas zhirmunskyi]
MTQICLHVGLHRTGTSSFQAALVEQTEDFLDAGITPYPGVNGSGHARRLSYACLREGVFDVEIVDADRAELRAQTRKDYADFIRNAPTGKLLFSSEHLSLIRTKDEIDTLRSLFPNKDTTFSIVIVLREKEDWFASYAAQIAKDAQARPLSAASRFNIAPDSWVRDFEPMIALFQQEFDDVTILHYDPEDMLGTLLAHFGVSPSFATRAYKRNKRAPETALGRLGYTVMRRVFGGEHRGIGKWIARSREKRRLAQTGEQR